MAIQDKDIAAGGVLDSFTYTQLFAGDAEVVTSYAPISTALKTSGAAKYTVVAKNAAGELILHDPAGSAPANKAIGFISQKIPAGYTGTNNHPIHVGGFYNHAALVWHASLDTLAERKAAFEGTPIFIGEVRL